MVTLTPVRTGAKDVGGEVLIYPTTRKALVAHSGVTRKGVGAAYSVCHSTLFCIRTLRAGGGHDGHVGGLISAGVSSDVTAFGSAT